MLSSSWAGPCDRKLEQRLHDPRLGRLAPPPSLSQLSFSRPQTLVSASLVTIMMAARLAWAFRLWLDRSQPCRKLGGLVGRDVTAPPVPGNMAAGPCWLGADEAWLPCCSHWS